jgi:transposase
MRAYSQDLRQRVLAAVDGRLPRAEAVRTFRVSSATLKRWLARRRAEGHVRPRPIPGPPARKGAALRAGLSPQLQAHPAATLEEHCRLWEQAQGVRVSTATMSRAITRHLGWTRKKRSSRRRDHAGMKAPAASYTRHGDRSTSRSISLFGAASPRKN